MKNYNKNRKISQLIDRLHLKEIPLRSIAWLTRHSDLPIFGHIIRLCGNFYTKNFIYGKTMVDPSINIQGHDFSYNHLHTVIDHENALNLLEKEKDLCVIDCMCRIIGKNCDVPLRTCILVGPEARRMIKSHPERRLTKAQAIDILRSCFDMALIHNAIFVIGHLVELCNCCKCCCVPILGIKKGFKSLRPSNYIAVKKDSQCRICGTCEKICPFGAITNGRTNREKCFGCGLCAYNCPKNSIVMLERRMADETVQMNISPTQKIY